METSEATLMANTDGLFGASAGEFTRQSQSQKSKSALLSRILHVVHPEILKYRFPQSYSVTCIHQTKNKKGLDKHGIH